MTALLMPQFALAGGLLGALSLGFSRSVPRLALRTAGAGALLLAALAALGSDTGSLPPLVRVDDAARLLQALFCLAALPIVLWGEADEVSIALTLGSVLGMTLLAVAGNLAMLFIGLEFMSLPAYLLTARGPRRAAALEGGLKYFFAGSAAGSLFLMGAALRYAETGTLDFAVSGGVLSETGLALMLAAALFKLGAVPLHFWLPDVYEAASAETAAFFSTAMKAAAVLFLMRLAALSPESPAAAALPWIGAVTALAGAVMGLRQKNLQRLLAYSSISHAGYLILGVGAWLRTDVALTAVVSYLAVYLAMSAGAFLWLKGAGAVTREDLRGHGRHCPWCAAVFAVLILALAGIPPTGGFVVKLLLFWDAIKAGLWGPTALAAFASLVALGYYLGLLKDLFLEDGPEHCARHASGIGALAAAAAAALTGLGLWLPRLIEGALR